MIFFHIIIIIFILYVIIIIINFHNNIIYMKIVITISESCLIKHPFMLFLEKL